jgi:regulator of cell morphogenesis and NO signaling
MTSTTQPVQFLVSERPARARVFQQMGIDIHRGSQTLAEACQQIGIDPAIVLEQLERTDQQSDSAMGDYSHMTLGDLCDQIVATHHARLKETLPRIGLMLYRVAEGDGDRHPELHRVLQLFSVFAGDLKLHMSKEEEILFPLIMELEEASTYCGHLSTLVEHLEVEDALTCEKLRQIRQLTRDFAPPGDACETYRAVLNALSDLEREVNDHSGVENNVLYPRAWQLEQMQMAEVV